MTTDTVSAHGAEFHFTWLRDNCGCAQCRHPENQSKLINLNTLSARPRPKEISVEDDVLVIEWDEDPRHRSEYSARWLAANSHDRSASDEVRPLPRLWDAASWETEPPSVFAMDTADPDGGPWADHLLQYGFAYFDGATEADVDRLATAIGPVQHTEFGRFITVEANPSVKDLTTTGLALDPHTDFSTYLHLPPLLQFMLFIENDASGGDSIYLDGYKVAHDLRAQYPEHFAALTATPINFQQIYRDWRYFLKRRRPIIETDPQGQVSGVFFAHSHTAAWQIPTTDMDAFYDAYHTFFRLIKDPRYQLRRRMQPGQCMAIQNGRILHGRTAFDPSSGPRSLIDAFVPWEYFVARRRFHQHQDTH